ncbi:hypothetical protein G9A89_011638 [Geosiphon pyriformis]|nr:hypothetical protein G9A89_011638 [Geosiphon pyriformis]
MGVQGLLQILKPIKQEISIEKYAWCTVGVDGHCWLHKGAHSCALELATNQPTKRYIDFFMHRVRMLKFYNVCPLIVFDGGNLPAKARTKEERKAQRAEHYRQGMEFLKKGLKDKARDCFSKAIEVTSEMVYQLILALKAEQVQYVVAPYEADAQLAYLEKNHMVAAVITEDSDLLVFGCQNVIFKMDQYGNGEEISRDNFGASHEFSMVGWTDRNFRQMAILSGCDYLRSIHGIGIKKAYQFIKKYRTAEKVIKFLQLHDKYHVPSDYEENFIRAELTFLHQKVFDLTTQRVVTFNPVPEQLDFEKLDFIGADISPNVAQGIALGELDPITKKPIKCENQRLFSIKSKTNYQDKRLPLRTSFASNKGPSPENSETISKFFAPKTSPKVITEESVLTQTQKTDQSITSDAPETVPLCLESLESTNFPCEQAIEQTHEMSQTKNEDFNEKRFIKKLRVLDKGKIQEPTITSKSTINFSKWKSGFKKNRDADKENITPKLAERTPKEIQDLDKEDREQSEETKSPLKKRGINLGDYEERVHLVAQGWRKKYARTENIG